MLLLRFQIQSLHGFISAASEGLYNSFSLLSRAVMEKLQCLESTMRNLNDQHEFKMPMSEKRTSTSCFMSSLDL